MDESALQSWLAAFRPGSEMLRVWRPEGGISSVMTASSFRFEGETTEWVLRQPNDWTIKHKPIRSTSQLSKVGSQDGASSELAGEGPWAPSYLPFGQPDIKTETMTQARQPFIDREVASR